MSVTPDPGAAAEADELGPVDVVVLSWPPGAPMTGEAAPLLLDLVEQGIIRIFDAMFVKKAEDGTVMGFEAKDMSAEDFGAFEVFNGASSGLLGDEDVQEAGSVLDPVGVAAIIVYENRWAAPFASAVRRNGGQVVDVQRISHQLLIEMLDATEPAV